MQVPPDLASRLAGAAASSGRSVEGVLRDTPDPLVDGTNANTSSSVTALDPTANAQRPPFVPQPITFSVYE
jgi:hypothetical protein